MPALKRAPEAPPVFYTMEQVQAMAENAARMAVAMHAQQLAANTVATELVVPVPGNVVNLKMAA